MLGCDIGGVLTETPIRRNSPSTRLKFPFLRFNCADDPPVQFGRYLCLYLFSLNTPQIPVYWSQLLRWPFCLISGDFVLYFCICRKLSFFIGPESDHWECLSVTHWLNNSVTLSRLYWCHPGVQRCQLKTCWGCYCCWCWWWESCWQQFVADLEADVWS